MNDPTRGSAIVRRILPASPERVYDEWLNPEALAEFLGPAPTRATILECDPHVGGRLHIVMSEDEGPAVNIECRFLELDRPHRLRLSWDSDMGGGFSSILTVTFEPYGDGETLMTIEHAPIPLDLSSDHEEGWTLIAEQLAALLGSR